jgi:SPP1 family predicted phage head-tail adaptor
MKLNAGRLREILTLEAPPADDDGAGGQTGGWTFVAQLRGAVVAVRGDEAAQAAIAKMTVQYRVTIRRRVVLPGQRLRWGGMALDIRAVLPDLDRAFVVLLCEGRAA